VLKIAFAKQHSYICAINFEKQFMIMGYSIRIEGKVQGVGFRYHTRKQAEILDIKGIVRNMDDGSVYIEAEGEEQNLLLFLQYCRKGPDRSIVSSAEMQRGRIQNFTEFHILG
jgi:acylphosphatase